MERFASFDGRMIAYAVEGEGPAVLCLPGLTRNMADFAELSARLSARFRVIRMDYRGRGESSWAENAVAEYAPPVESQDAVMLLAHLGIARTAIIGTSRGGLIGMGLAAHGGALVSCLVLNDVGPVLERAGLEAIRTYLGKPPEAESFEAAAHALAAGQRLHFPDLTHADWLAHARRIYRDEGGRPSLSYDPRLREAMEAALAQPLPDLWQVFDAIEVPMLAIRGANSDLFSAATLEEMARRKPSLRTVTVPDRGHVPFLNEAAAVAAIDAFLAEHAE